MRFLLLLLKTKKTHTNTLSQVNALSTFTVVCLRADGTRDKVFSYTIAPWQYDAKHLDEMQHKLRNVCKGFGYVGPPKMIHVCEHGTAFGWDQNWQITGGAINCCSWALRQMKILERWLFQASPPTGPRSGTRRKRFEKDLTSFHKFVKAFTYVWENHRDDADWFIKADDDTFVILENLKYKTSLTLICIQLKCC